MPLYEVETDMHIMITWADDDDQARLLRSSSRQSILSMRRGRPIPLPPPRADFEEGLGQMERAMLDEAQSCSAVGGPEAVRTAIEAFVARTGADELIIASAIHDHAARLRSFEIVAEVMGLTASAAGGG